jgi:predicted secreted protein
MNLIGAIATYFVVWWVILFAVLPWGVRTQEEEGEVTLGTVRSAPAKPMLVRKAIATSITAAVIVGALWLAMEHYGFDSKWMVDFTQSGGPGSAPVRSVPVR